MNVKDPFRLLLVQYSLSGETHKATEELLRGIQDEYSNVSIVKQDIQVQPAFPFPWTLWGFFDVMPETVVETSFRERKYSVVPVEADLLEEEPFDLMVLGWQTWYLCPSLPVQLALEDQGYQQLLQKSKGVVLVGTHRNMWHRASRSLTNSLGKSRIVGKINFVQSSGFLTSVVQTLQRQLRGTEGVGGTTAKDDAYQEGRQFAKHYSEQKTGRDVEVYHGGKPFSPVLSFCEEVWFPMKRLGGRVMGYFPPGSLGRKMVALVYVPLLVSAIIGLAPPVLLVGSLAGWTGSGPKKAL